MVNSHTLYTCANSDIHTCTHTPTRSPDMANGCVGDMVELGITESFQVKRQVLISAAEAAEMILRVDDIIKAAPR